jgi:peptidyl-prolyl cis-trans isomerase C
MSIQGMRRRFAVQLRYVLWALTLAFVIGLPLMFSGGRSIGGDERRPEDQAQSTAAVVQVNGKPITRGEVQRTFDRVIAQLLPLYASMGQDVGLERLWQFRLEAMEQAIQSRLLVEEATSEGISISKSELKQRAEQQVDQQMAQLKGQFEKDDLEKILAQIVAENDPEERPRSSMSERQFRKWALNLTLEPSSGLREDMQLDRLRQSLVGAVSATEQDLLKSYDRAALRHIVVSRVPPGEPERTDEEAKKRAEALLARINAGEDFTNLAKAESDDPMAAETGGLMEGFAPGRMPQEWDEAVFSLKPGQVSPVISAPSGYEIVQMVKVERQLPKDFESNKEQLLASFTRQKQEDVWREHTMDLREKAEVEIVDPEMRGYQAGMEGKPEEAIAFLKEAATQARAEGGLGAAAVFFELANLEALQSNWEGAADAYAEAGDALLSDKAAMLPGGRAQALMGMAQAYEQLGELEEAVMWYTAASESTDSPSLHSHLRMTFQRLGKGDLAAREAEWMDNYEALQQERQEAMEAEAKSTQEREAESQAPAPVEVTP